MRCMNDFCVYWLNNGCLLKSVSINSHGFCSSCVHYSVDKDVMVKYREMLMKKLEENDNSEDKAYNRYTF